MNPGRPCVATGDDVGPSFTRDRAENCIVYPFTSGSTPICSSMLARYLRARAARGAREASFHGIGRERAKRDEQAVLVDGRHLRVGGGTGRGVRHGEAPREEQCANRV